MARKEDGPLELDLVQQREQVHSLIDILPEDKLATVQNFVESLVNPVSHAVASAPDDHEPVSEQERRAVAESKDWLARHPGQSIAHSEMLAEFGLSPESLKG